MDVRVRNVLSTIRASKEGSNAIVFGGAARDSFFNITPDTYDIAIQSSAWSKCVDILHKNGMLSASKTLKNSSIYMPLRIKFASFKYENLDFTLSGFDTSQKDSFTSFIMDQIDYGISRVYFEGGDQIHETTDFTKDNKRRTLSLLSLSDVSSLPRALNEFKRINERLGGDWEFRCPLLKLEQLVKEDVPKYNPNVKPERIEPLVVSTPRREVNTAWIPGGRGRVNPVTFQDEATEVAELPAAVPPELPMSVDWRALGERVRATEIAATTRATFERMAAAELNNRNDQNLDTPRDLGDSW